MKIYNCKQTLKNPKKELTKVNLKNKCNSTQKREGEKMEELSWREKIVAKILAKTFYKVYKIGIMFGFNKK